MSRHTSKYIYLLLLVFPLILFSPIIFTGRAIFWGTPLTQFIPWWTLAWQMLEKGIPPLWNTLSGMGAPLLANYQSALIYPPTWIYFLFYKAGGVPLMAWGQALSVILHLFWAGLGMAFLIRQLGFGRMAQLIAGLSFGMSGYLVSRAGFLSINASASWIPWIILGITKLVDEIPADDRFYDASDGLKKFNASWSLVASFLLLLNAFTMQLLAGHAQTTWYTLILSVFWLGFLVYLNLGRKRSGGNEEYGTRQNGGKKVETIPSSLTAGVANRRATIRYILVVGMFFGVALIFAAALAAGQLLPTGEYLLQSQRSSSVEYDFAMTYSFWPWRFLTFLTPDLYGNPVRGDYWGYANYWEDAVYIGLIPFSLAIFALLRRQQRSNGNKYRSAGLKVFLFLVIVVVFLIALGKNTPVFPWLYSNIVTFDMFQAPTRITILSLFCLSILAAIGADAWRRPGEKSLYWLRLGVMAAAAVSIGAAAAYLLSRSITLEIRPSFIRAAAMFGLLGVGFGLLALNAPKKNYDQLEFKWSWWHWAVILWLGLDLIIAGWGLNPGTDLSLYREPAPTADQVGNLLVGGRLFLSSDEEYELKYERFLRFDTFQPFDQGQDWNKLRASLLPNVAILDEIPSANNFDPLIPGRYSNWMTNLEEVGLDLREQMLNLMGVAVVESIDSGSAYGVRFDSREAEFQRFRWVGCGILAESESRVIDLILQKQVDFNQSVILEGNADGKEIICNQEVEGEVRLISDQANKSVFSVDSLEHGYLVVSDLWYPGWQASVDSAGVPILRANYLFRAVEVPQGNHEVTFEYKSNTVKIGFIISGLSLILLLSLISYWFVSSKKLSTRDERQVK